MFQAPSNSSNMFGGPSRVRDEAVEQAEERVIEDPIDAKMEGVPSKARGKVLKETEMVAEKVV